MVPLQHPRDQAGENEGVAADVPSRLEADALMGMTDGSGMFAVGGVEGAGKQLLPVEALRALEPVYRAIADDGPRLVKPGHMVVKPVEDAVEAGFKQISRRSQAGTHPGINLEQI